MGEFFQGWRRKIGCVALLVAFVFMLGWIRSFQTEDVVTLASGKISLGIDSKGGKVKFLLFRFFDVQLRGYLRGDETSWNTFDVVPMVPTSLRNEIPPSPDDDTQEVTKFCGASYGKVVYLIAHGKSVGRLEIRSLSFPYVQIVLPLTLLSAFLILSMPGTSKHGSGTSEVPNWRVGSFLLQTKFWFRQIRISEAPDPGILANSDSGRA